MKSLAISLLTAALVLSAPAGTLAALKTARPPGSTPFTDLVTALDVEPARIVINGTFESTQVVVTAKLASGVRMDVTGLATFRMGGDVAVVTPEGEVRPVRAGNGTLHVELAGHTVQIPIEIMRIQSRAAADFI